MPSSRTSSERISARSSLEPVNGLRIDLTANRTETSNYSTFFRYQLDTNTVDPDDGDWVSQSPVQNGTYSTSVILWKTAFQKDDDQNKSEAFENFRDYRGIISKQLADRAKVTDFVDTTGYYSGFGGESQEVVIPSFYMAYKGGDVNKTQLNIFDIIPLPGWRITFDGLSKIKQIKKYARTVIVSHGYSSDMNTSYVTNLRAGADDEGRRFRNEINDNYIPERQISTVTITERFNPLINVDVTWVNSLSTKIEIKKDRTISLSMANLNVNEVRGKELVIGLGYRFKGIALPFKIGARTVKNDLNLRADFTIRDNTTIIRKVVENENQLTSGRRIISIKTAADYSLSKNLNIRIYYDKQITKPQLSVPFPTSNSNAGFSLRYTLTN